MLLDAAQRDTLPGVHHENLPQEIGTLRRQPDAARNAVQGGTDPLRGQVKLGEVSGCASSHGRCTKFTNRGSPGRCGYRCLDTADPRMGTHQPAYTSGCHPLSLPEVSENAAWTGAVCQCLKGRRRTNMMYRVTPQDQTSARRPSYCRWLSTSGATYLAEPTSDFGIECRTADCEAQHMCTSAQ